MMKGIAEVNQEFIKTLYPCVEHKDKMVFYDPEIHTLEKGEAVFYYDAKFERFGKGIITHVNLSKPEENPVYTIANKVRAMKHRVWPDPDGQEKLEKVRISAVA